MNCKINFRSTLIIAMVAGCTPKVETEVNQVEKSQAPAQTYLLGATLFTQQSAEYRALCYQAYHLAAIQLQARDASPSGNEALVFDIDETLLDNSPYTAWQIAEDEPYSPDTWTRWVEMAQAEAVPGAVAFAKLADSLGYRLFFISNRDTSHLAPTIKNMDQLGFPQLDPANFMLRTTTSDKTSRRDSVIAMGYSIAMFVGDNLGDYSGVWDKPATSEQRRALVDSAFAEIGQQFIVLPNTIYGTWEGALYDYNRDFTDLQLDSIRRSKTIPL